MRDGHNTPPLAEQFRRFAKSMGRDGAGRYEKICNGVADDEDLLRLVEEAPPSQRRPNILLAAVHFLLLSGVQHQLARHYPTVAAFRGEPVRAASRAGGGDAFPDFAAFCRDHRRAVAELVTARATQTNEVGRCSALLPAFAMISARAGRPLAIVDLGAAAGLNLLFDRYAYDYGPLGPTGNPNSEVVLRCEVRSGAPPLETAPVAARLGVDRQPVDVRDEESARWLLACEWPDHLDRFTAVQAAIGAARRCAEKPVVARGDVVKDLARLAAPLSPDAHLCVFHTWVAAYFTPDEQEELGRSVAELARRRPVSWLFAEAPYEVPALPVPPAEGEQHKEATALVLVEHTPAGRQVHRLADMHSHGRWLHWYGVR